MLKDTEIKQAKPKVSNELLKSPVKTKKKLHSET